MNGRMRLTLARVYQLHNFNQGPDPLTWPEVEDLFRFLGASLDETPGDCVCVRLNGHDSVFERPRHVSEALLLEQVRLFLALTGYSAP